MTSAATSDSRKRRRSVRRESEVEAVVELDSVGGVIGRGL